ncbi:MAG: phospholipase D/transphosphatidylase [Bacillota bacterium]|jgi:cardiolipin synthase|nr:phospholipase D/transphosphatidylase [Bacillota bacterium]
MKQNQAKAYKTTLFILIMAVQLILLIGFIIRFNRYFSVFYGFNVALSVACVFWILNNKSNPSYKIAWIILIMLFPVFGGLFYLFFSGNRTSRKTAAQILSISKVCSEILCTDGNRSEELKHGNQDAFNQSSYLRNFAGYPLYRNFHAQYLANGEAKFEKLKEELTKAEQSIYLEYFIIEEGLMWNSILDILTEKAALGVDVRIIYDAAGCLETLPLNYSRYLEAKGIKCSVFNPMVPLLSPRLNNRDHRKIAVIDGHTGFVGGINLADEYINHIEKHGHWKDAALMMKGEAVRSLTVMFFSMWSYLRNEPIDQDCAIITDGDTFDGYLCPFADSPLDGEPVSQNVYLNLINKAERSVYITTPYLIIDHEMVNALCNAAKCGVDVRIITPHQGDKWYVHPVSQSYYSALIESGVKIYEYEPGFIHSKTFVVDGCFGVVGTINMDYRSLYLHFECGVWMYQCSCLADMVKDFEDIIAVGVEITKEDLKHFPLRKRVLMSLLRLFSPLM